MSRPTLTAAAVLLIFSTLFLSTTALLFKANSPAVLDLAGNPLKTNTNYYILPLARGMGGGLTLTTLNGSTCPLNVAQELLEVSNGLPVRFLPVDPRKTMTVEIGANTNFVFSRVPMCAKSGVWANGDDGLVVANGIAGQTRVDPSRSWYTVATTDDGFYKLLFCPCLNCRIGCFDLGITIDESTGRRYLGSAGANSAFRVVFKKA